MAGMERKHCFGVLLGRVSEVVCRVQLTITKKYLVAPPMSPSLVMTAMVKHAATKTNTAWKQCATTLHFWIYDCGIRILWYV